MQVYQHLEILSRLTGDGFVLSLEQKGFCVSPVSKSDLIEIANLRILIESHALKKSIENSTTDWEAELLSAHHKLKIYENDMLKNKYNNKNDWKKEMIVNFIKHLLKIVALKT